MLDIRVVLAEELFETDVVALGDLFDVLLHFPHLPMVLPTAVVDHVLHVVLHPERLPADNAVQLHLKARVLARDLPAVVEDCLAHLGGGVV